MFASSSRSAGHKVVRHLMPPRPRSSEPLTTPDVRVTPTHRPWHPTSAFPAYPSPQAPFEHGEHTHWLVQQTRSAIGLPADRQKTLNALGLFRRHRYSLKKFHPGTAGQILAVKELVSVKTCTKEYGEFWMKRIQSRGEGSGLETSGRLYGGQGGKMSTQWVDCVCPPV